MDLYTDELQKIRDEDKSLFDSIVVGNFLQAGLGNSPFQINQIIPAELYHNLTSILLEDFNPSEEDLNIFAKEFALNRTNLLTYLSEFDLIDPDTKKPDIYKTKYENEVIVVIDGKSYTPQGNGYNVLQYGIQKEGLNLFGEDIFDNTEQEVIEQPIQNKEGINFIFEQSPELASIGSKTQYLQYLSTIFKTSKVKDIVYHGSGVNIISKEGWKTGKETGTGHRGVLGYYFSKYLLDAKIYAQRAGSPKGTPEFLLQQGYIVPVLVNAVSKTIETEVYDKFAEIRRWDENYLGFDTVAYGQGLDENKEVVVKSKEQIHILASKQDIEKFKKFVEQSIQKDIKEVSIQMQPDNIKKILNGTKTTTTRSESQSKEIGLSVGESGITTIGGKQFKVTNRGLLSISEAGGKEAMEKSENFENNTPKYQQTKDWLQGKGKLYVYDFVEQPINKEIKPKIDSSKKIEESNLKQIEKDFENYNEHPDVEFYLKRFVGKITDDSLMNLCDMTSSICLSFLHSKGINILQRPFHIYPKLPIANFKGNFSNHKVAISYINNKMYIFDMPQNEYITLNSKNQAVIGEFKPRFIEVTPENMLKYYGIDKESYNNTFYGTTPSWGIGTSSTNFMGANKEDMIKFDGNISEYFKAGSPTYSDSDFKNKFFNKDESVKPTYTFKTQEQPIVEENKNKLNPNYDPNEDPSCPF